MITKDKKKLRLKTKSKILVLGLILVVLVGVFSFIKKADAQVCTGVGVPDSSCGDCLTSANQGGAHIKYSTQAQCGVPPNQWFVSQTNAAANTAAQNAPKDSDFANTIGSCGWLGVLTGFPCLFQKIIYVLFVAIPSFLMIFAAKFFNFVTALTLSSSMYEAPFISTIWTIVRDFANIFFILILLYAAIKIILELGHGDGKKIVASVIVIALLVNFSLFFTKVVIDSSNIVALIFYNKIDTTNTKYTPTGGTTNTTEKDMAGALVSRFNPNELFSGKVFETIKKDPNNKDGLGFFLKVAIMILYGLIAYALVYAFFMVGLAMFGRMLNLMMLMIVSPLAFVTKSVPKMSGINTIGFDSWLKKLLETSFMAAVFMFIVYIISEILRADVFKINPNYQETVAMLVVLFMPAILIVMLLLKGVKYAKEASGEFTGAVITGAKVAGGLAIGGAALGTAFAGRTAIARTTAAMSRRPGAQTYGRARFEYSKEYKKWERDGKKGAAPTKPTAPGNILDRFGAKINQSQWKSGNIAHDRHEMEELKKKIGVEGLGDKFLSGVDRKRMEETYIKDKRSEIEGDIRRGSNAKGEVMPPIEIKDAGGINATTDSAGRPITARDENDYKAQRRQAIIDDIATVADPKDWDSSAGKLTNQGERKVEDKLNTEFNEGLRKLAEAIGQERYVKLEKGAGEKVGIGTMAMAKTTSGTYDPRNLAEIGKNKGGSLSYKATAGLIAIVATGLRMGLKQGAGVEVGTPKGDFMLDLKNTIADALKNISVKVDVSNKGSSHTDSQGTSGGGHH
ncbi:MAG: hypothetical protein Q8O46_01425 [bacterium]|nr:hypothetical protein [bacterium]